MVSIPPKIVSYYPSVNLKMWHPMKVFWNASLEFSVKMNNFDLSPPSQKRMKNPLPLKTYQ